MLQTTVESANAQATGLVNGATSANLPVPMEPQILRATSVSALVVGLGPFVPHAILNAGVVMFGTAHARNV